MHFLSLISVYISNFIKISLELFELWSWHGNNKVLTREIIWKLFNIKLWFLYYALSFTDMYVYFKFYWNIFSTFRIMLNANKVWRKFFLDGHPDRHPDLLMKCICGVISFDVFLWGFVGLTPQACNSFRNNFPFTEWITLICNWDTRYKN